MARVRSLVFVAGLALPSCGVTPPNAGAGQDEANDGSTSAASTSTASPDSTSLDAASSGSETGGGSGQAEITFDRIVLSDEYFCEGANVGDFDNDGILDVVAGPYWYRGPDYLERNTIYASEAFNPSAYADNFFAAVEDFDGDGFEDVFFVGFPGQRATWYENPGSRNGVWLPHVVLTGVDGESPAFTDLTGDGRRELVFIQGGRWGWAGPAPGSSEPLWVFHPISPRLDLTVFTHGLGVGDIDGDGRNDIIEATGWWRQPASLDGDPRWAHHEHAFGLGGAQMFSRDLDGDGDNDVITSYEAHGYGLSWFEQDAGSFSEHTFAPKSDDDAIDGPLIHEPHALTLADIDGDGTEDLVTGERFWAHVPAGAPSLSDPARLYWFQWRGTPGPGRWVPHLIDEASGVGTQVVAVDLNGDEHPDIVVANKKGTFVFLRRPHPTGRSLW